MQSRLAENGGALGVRIETFFRFSQEILSLAGKEYATVSETTRLRLIQHVVNQFPLEHYAPLRNKPGFIQKLAEIIHILKDAKILPEDFLVAIDRFEPAPRLRELGLIYQTYQSLLHDLEWADKSGWAWLAEEALREDGSNLTSRWPLLIVDGFDNFSGVLLDMLEIMADTVDETIVTLTEESEDQNNRTSRQAFKLFQATKERLEEKLRVKAEALPRRTEEPRSTKKPGLNLQAQLERNLFRDGVSGQEGGKDLFLIACPDRAAEVRAALRWLKERIVNDGMQLQEVALLVRAVGPYEPFIRQTAAEFKLPIHLSGQAPLSTNPAIVAIVKLLELHLPISEEDSSPALPRQGVVDAWRSPYFKWANAPTLEANDENTVITAVDAEVLDALARNGRVIGGLDQWEELLPLKQVRSLEDPSRITNSEDRLAFKFTRFQSLLEPPAGAQSYRDFTEWFDMLLGPDPEKPAAEGEGAGSPFLQLWNPDGSTDDEIYRRDLAALSELKEIMRSMVSVEDKVGTGSPVSFRKFITNLAGMIDATSYSLPEWQRSDKIFVADVIQARGLAFRATAILGLAEGEFPKTYVEDPFLWEDDRSRLSRSEDVLLDSSIESFEREYFYQAVTRPREKLLLTRPRLADSGAEWQPSPFWEDVQRLFDVQPIQLTTESVPAPDEAASLTELVGSMVVYPDCRPAMDHLEEETKGRIQRLYESARNFDRRFSRARTPSNGDLTNWARLFKQEFNSSYGWSPSSLESYHNCPYLFFVGRVLRLEPRLEPAEGMNAAQQGTIYHQIFEQLYKTLDIENRTNPDKLLAILPSVARRILDAAPAKRGFRETAWWRETRQEIANNVARSIQALAEVQEDFVPVGFELGFSDANTLTVYDGDDHFLLRGIIDRVDRDEQGRSRVIDYKTAGPYKYTKQTLESGEKIQIALYALAARDAFGYGEVVDGFYWHVYQATPSKLKLREYGPAEAIDVAVGHAWASVRGARQGYFLAKAPADGCPSWCPAAAFCWNYRPGLWG
jgi:ATP-dependent helicase/DNAse subunit B